MSEKGQAQKSMFSVQNMEELRGLYDSDTPVLAYDFKTGKRPATIMHQLAKGYTDEQIDALAAYFSAQKAR